MTEEATHHLKRPLLANLEQVAVVMFYIEFSAHYPACCMIYQTGNPHTGVIS